jgi:hypothetical protein
MISYDLFTKKQLIERLIILENELLRLSDPKKSDELFHNEDCICSDNDRFRFEIKSMRDLQFEINRRTSVIIDKIEADVSK